MKSALLGTIAGLIVAIVAVTSSCSIHHRSESYACTTNTDCDSGRICDNGFCIVAGSIDAPKGDGRPPDGQNCPEPCTTCNTTQKTCTINCMTANCTSSVTCPAGYRCDILCNTDNACRNGVNCQQSLSCNVECSSKQACQNVSCGTGPCDVACTGEQSCRNVLCGASCACDVVCTGLQSCQEGILCSSLACKSGSGCTSVPALCNSCN